MVECVCVINCKAQPTSPMHKEFEPCMIVLYDSVITPLLLYCDMVEGGGVGGVVVWRGYSSEFFIAGVLGM